MFSLVHNAPETPETVRQDSREQNNLLPSSIHNILKSYFISIYLQSDYIAEFTSI
jgi:hypothetical protein